MFRVDRRYALPLALTLLCSLLTCGCGTSKKVRDQAQQKIERYLKNQEVKPHVKEAMVDRKLVEGMTPVEVKLVLAARSGYSREPSVVTEAGKGEIWLYKGTRWVMPPVIHIVIADGVVTSVAADEGGLVAPPPK